MTGSAGLQTVRRYLDALNRHDADAVVRCVSGDFVNEHTATGGQNRYGREVYRAALDEFLVAFRDLRYEPETFIADGDRVAVPYRLTFRHQPSGGAPVDVRGAFVFRLDRHALIVHRTDYWDSAEVTRQIAKDEESEVSPRVSGSA